MIVLDGCCENDRCLTVTQQGLIAGFHAAVQMELALVLRRLLAKDEALRLAFAKSIGEAWNETYSELAKSEKSDFNTKKEQEGKVKKIST